jgi:DNA polymerase III epsilon subunit-like protein
VRDIVVAVDLETTGLNPNTDRILEIGAIRFRGDEVLEEWHSLVNPGCPVPHYITQLTGLRDQDVRRTSVTIAPISSQDASSAMRPFGPQHWI